MLWERREETALSKFVEKFFLTNINIESKIKKQ